MPNRDKTQSIESRPAPSRSSSSVSQTQPAIKVVGFRVEGAAPSPSPPSTLLTDSQRLEGNVVSGSPNPVIIPPSFQVRLPVQSTGLYCIPCPDRLCHVCDLCVFRQTHPSSKQLPGGAAMPHPQHSQLFGSELLLSLFPAVFQTAATCRCQSPSTSIAASESAHFYCTNVALVAGSVNFGTPCTQGTWSQSKVQLMSAHPIKIYPP